MIIKLNRRNTMEVKKRGRKPMDDVEKKKRGRKPKIVAQPIVSKGILPELKIQEPLILQLNVKIDEAEDKINMTDVILNGYDKDNMTESIPENIKDVEYEYTTQYNIIGDKYCEWCCHKFDTNIISLPIKYYRNKFYVSGCFCSFECGAAFIFGNENSIYNKWEMYSLLNIMAKKSGYSDIVYLAPDRAALRIFGGNMDIEEFRGSHNCYRTINIYQYPMITCNKQVEEIRVDCNMLSTGVTFIPINENRVKELEQKIKRDKSKSTRSNLENFLNITASA